MCVYIYIYIYFFFPGVFKSFMHSYKNYTKPPVKLWTKALSGIVRCKILNIQWPIIKLGKPTDCTG